MMKLFRNLLTFVLCMILCVSTAVIASAGEDAAIVQAYISDDRADLFITGGQSEASVKISGFDCEILNNGLLGESNVPVHTTFLVDISTSIRKASQQAIIALMSELIEKKPEKDSFAIATMGDETRMIQELTPDRYELIKAVDGLEFNNQSSSIYDAVKQMTPDLRRQKKDELVFSQIVVISDGVEKSATGIIKEELFHHLTNNPYPVHTIGFKYENNTDGLKELFAISRITGAKNFEADGNTDISKLAGDIAQFSADICRLGFTLPLEAQDGAVRQLDITYGGSQLQYDMRMPVAEATATVPPDDIEDDPPPAAETPPEADAPPKTDSPPKWPWILAVAAIIAIGGGITAKILLGKPKKSEQKKPEPQIPEPQIPEPKKPVSGDKPTVWLDDKKTQGLIPNMPPKTKSIILIDLKQTNKRFEAPIMGEVVIGREAEKCQVVIDYQFVSRRHCKIYEKGGSLWIEDLGSANKTKVNGTVIQKPEIIKSNDIISLGKADFSVTIRQDSNVKEGALI